MIYSSHENAELDGTPAHSIEQKHPVEDRSALKREHGIAPQDCPQYYKCNAPICPVDRRWRDRTHLKGEPVCLWLRERAKPDGIARVRGVMPQELAEEIAEAESDIRRRHGPIKRALNQARKTGSKIAAGQRLNTAA